MERSTGEMEKAVLNFVFQSPFQASFESLKRLLKTSRIS